MVLRLFRANRQSDGLQPCRLHLGNGADLPLPMTASPGFEPRRIYPAKSTIDASGPVRKSKENRLTRLEVSSCLFRVRKIDRFNLTCSFINRYVYIYGDIQKFLTEILKPLERFCILRWTNTITQSRRSPMAAISLSYLPGSGPSPRRAQNLPPPLKSPKMIQWG